MADIKETKEVLAMVNNLSVKIIGVVKKGFEISDLTLLLTELESIKTGLDGIELVGDELKDLDRAEIIEISSLGIALVFDVIDALKAENG